MSTSLTIENPVTGDGFIFDGVRFIKVAPTMETYALIRKEAEIIQLLDVIENLLRETDPNRDGRGTDNELDARAIAVEAIIAARGK